MFKPRTKAGRVTVNAGFTRKNTRRGVYLFVSVVSGQQTQRGYGWAFGRVTLELLIAGFQLGGPCSLIVLSIFYLAHFIFVCQLNVYCEASYCFPPCTEGGEAEVSAPLIPSWGSLPISTSVSRVHPF